MSRFPLEGGCHCGAVRYVLREPALSVQHCHCGRCRKIFGTLFASGAVVRRDVLTIAGEENLSTYRSSETFADLFCSTCGCHLFATEDSDPTLMYITPATLDGGVHPGHPPNKESHIYMGSRAEWDRTADDLARFETTSPDEIITGIQKSEVLDRPRIP